MHTGPDTGVQRSRVLGHGLRTAHGGAALPGIFLVLACLVCLWAAGPVHPLHAASTDSSVLRITARDGSSQRMGTAFYVHPNILATSYHVIQGATTITAVRDTTRVRITSLLAFDPKRDVALLYTPLEGPALPLGWEDLEPFAQVQALGFVSEGSVQKIPAVFMAWEQIAGIWHMRLQGPVQPGMSGGPVLNREGRVVGLNRFTAGPDTPSAAVAVGVRAMRRFLDRSLAEAKFMDLAAFARKTGNRPKLQTRDNRLLITDQ